MGMNYLSHKISMVNGLITACPLDEPKFDCPAISARMLSAEDRLLLLKTMKVTELDLIISHHRNCFQIRIWEQSYIQKELQFPQQPAGF
jgi:hypothetical protein